MTDLTPKQRLDELRKMQGDTVPTESTAEASPKQRLEELRQAQGDINGEGQGDTPSTNPMFELARNSGFFRGYLDQAAGIVQMADKLKEPDVWRKKRELQGLETPDAVNIDKAIEAEEGIYQNRRKERGEDGIDWARLGGNLANPVSIATATTPVGKIGAARKVVAGARAGVAAGLSQPVLDTEDDFISQKALQGTLGGSVGALSYPVIATIRGAGDFGRYVLPFLRKGKLQNDIAETYVRLAGKSKNKIISALDNAKTHVLGNKPTSGQAIAEGMRKSRTSTGLSADELIEGVKSGRWADMELPDSFGNSIIKMEHELAKRGITGEELKKVLAQQIYRRKNAVNGLIDQSDEAMEIAVRNRTNATKPLYDQVEVSKKLVRVGDVLNKARNLVSKNINNDAVTRPMGKIISALKKDNTLETNPQNLYSLSKSIKRMIESKTPGGSNEFDVKALSEVKKLLDSKIGKAEPSFAKAQYLFRKYSEPVNQIEVSKVFGKALENSVREEKAAPFLSAMDDAAQTLKKSTGFPRFKKLDDVMNPKQIKILNKIKQELLRNEKASQSVNATETAFKELSGDIDVTFPNMLSRPVMLANAVLRRVGKGMSPEYERLAIRVQKDPKLLSSILKSSEKSKDRRMLTELLTRYAEMTPALELSRQDHQLISE